MYAYTDEEGEFAVKAARKTVEAFFEKKDPEFEFPPKFEEKSGVFTTISTYPHHNLRGCIGFPEPYFPLKEALIKSALAAAFDDPRFPPLRREELEHVVFEVSLLTPPEEIVVNKRKDLLKEIVIGKHGLIADRGLYRGLLLPQVPVEWHWNVKQFLEQTCMKAGLPPNCWKDKRTRFYRFTAEIFEEETPHGKIRRKEI
ncbi:MAG: TIGR00296 family protein [Euryarchaeota archaeon]|nr:TIGR00296 family protein [Euryarchaeota archaeon]